MARYLFNIKPCSAGNEEFDLSLAAQSE